MPTNAQEFVIGLECKLFRNTAVSDTWATPTWNECDNVRDISPSDERAKVDFSRRGIGNKQYRAGLKDISLDIDFVYKRGDADWQAFMDAYNNNTKIDLWAADGLVDAPKTQGPRFEAAIVKAPRTEGLEDGMVYTFTAVPFAGANAAQWKVIPDA